VTRRRSGLALAILSIGCASIGFAAIGCASKEGPGLKISVDLGDSTGAASMKVAISADHGGFAFQMPDNPDGIGVTTEDLDGDGALELVAEFVRPDPTVSFRVKADSQVALNMTVKAMAFDSDDLIASADGAAPTLPPGGDSAIALRLQTDMSPVGANTRTTDLGTATTDIAVWGRQADVNMSSLAVCDVDGDGAQDIVIGAPADGGVNLAATGAVYIVWGGWPTGTTVDLAAQNAKATVFYGTAIAEHLGTSIACVDLDGDGIGDIVAGAPGADLGRGRIYVVFGRLMFRNSRTVDLSTAATTGADIVWKATMSSGTAALGSTLLAVGKSRGVVPFILASAPGAMVTHLLSDVRPPATPGTPRQLDADTADHPIFTGAAVAAMAAGELDDAPDSGKPLDIALGDPTYRDVDDTARTRGRVYLFSAVDPTGTAPIDVASATPTITGTDVKSQLGKALLIADTSGGGEDLLVGAPGDDGNGAVYVFKHSTGLFLPPMLSTTNTDTTIKIAGYETGGLFGSALASTRAGSASPVGLRLVVGAPNVSRPGRVAIGAAYLYKADASRRFRIFEQVYGAAEGDALGSAVAGGQLNGDPTQTDNDQIGDLVTAAPNARGSDAATGAVYVRYGQ
jgi:hypothetical protein